MKLCIYNFNGGLTHPCNKLNESLLVKGHLILWYAWKCFSSSRTAKDTSLAIHCDWYTQRMFSWQIHNCVKCPRSKGPFWIREHLFWKKATSGIRGTIWNMHSCHILISIWISVSAKTGNRVLGLPDIELMHAHGNDGYFRLSHQSRYLVKASAVADMRNGHRTCR